jgi:predicted small lipoprotein YifL
MLFTTSNVIRSASVLLLMMSITGCGEKDVGPIQTPTEEHKQQIEELNQQRVDEWGNKVK